MSDIIDPSKLKVAELRAELQKRGLDTKGNKPVLVERLKEALEEENAEEGNDTVEDVEADAEEEQPEGQEAEPSPSPEPEPSPEVEQEPSPSPSPEPPKSSPQKTPAKEPEMKSPQKSPEKTPAKSEPAQSPQKSPAKSEPAQSPQKSPTKSPAPAPQPSPRKAPEQSPKKAPAAEEQSDSNSAIKEEPQDKFGYEDAPMEDVEVKNEPGNGMDTDIKTELSEVKQEETEEAEPKRGEKRRLSRSRSPEAKRSRPEVEELRVEDEPEMDKNVVTLDWYNSDLSLVINKEDFLSAQPLTMQGFGYVWHGVRANQGFTHGRVFYQVRVDDYLPVPQLEDEEQHPHVLRVGWSVNDAGLTLGEDPLSYGYGGTAKASTNLKFKDYGKKFGKGDIVGCYLDLESEPIVMSFTVNGEHQGIAYEINHSELGDQALFPHIVTKNASFKVNFGQEAAWTPPLTGYTFAGEIPADERVSGSERPAKREEAEVIMMVGLPAAGKTTWVENYCQENLEKKYNVLGTNSLIDKMKVNGLPRRRNYAGRWEVLIERCTKCLNKLLELGYKRRRNFIIDQTNVYPSAQRRKMKGFAGFKRRAVVICPTDEDLKKRTEKREKEEGKDVPDKAVLEMKANFKLPEEGELFDSVEFVELDKEEGTKLVEQYNKEGEDAGFGQKKGFRGGFAERRGGFMDRRGGYGNRGGGFRGGWDRDRRGGYNDRRDRSSWNRDRDSRDYRSGGYNRDNRGGSGGGSYNRDYNNRGSYNRDSRGGGSSGGGSYNRDNRGGSSAGSGGGRSNYQGGNWNRNSTDTKTTSSTNSWATSQQGGGQQGYGGYNYAGNQAWGAGNYGGYGQGSYSGNWNQQYYQQQQTQQPQTAATQQQQQQYWGTGYNYGQAYGAGQYGNTGSGQTGTAGSWNQGSNWGSTGQQGASWGNAYGRQQWGSSGSSSSSGSTNTYGNTASTGSQRR